MSFPVFGNMVYIKPEKLREIEQEPDKLYRLALILKVQQEEVQPWAVADNKEVVGVSAQIIEENRPAYKCLAEVVTPEEAAMQEVESLWDKG